MTTDMDRRSNPDGKRQIVWPEWVRIGYRAMTTKWGQRLIRCAFGVLVFGVIAGGITLYVIKHVPPEKVEVIERKVETIEQKAEGAERRTEQETETIEHRLERLEQIITDVITAP